MSGSKQAKVDVILNTEQAQSALKGIQTELKQVKTLREKAFEAGDVKGFNQLNTEFKKLTTEAGKFTKQTFDVNAVMKNLSGASVRELNTAYKQTNEELKNLKRNDPGYAAKQQQVKALKDELNSATGTMSKQGTTLTSLMGTLGGWATGLGIATGAMSAIKAVIGATDTLSDKFSETIGGLSAGMSYLSRSIATLDFSNFLTNMGSAIKAGSDYVSTLDKIGDRTRAIGIIESNDRARLAELLIIRKDVTKSDKERLEAGKEILSIEQKNAERRKSISKDELEAELKYASKMTGLSEERVAQLLTEQETNRDAIKNVELYNEALEMKRNAEIIAGQLSQKTGKFITPIISKETLETINSATPGLKKLASELKSFGKLNEEEYDRITNAYKKVGEANAYYSETTAKTQTGMAKLMKGQLEENESEVKKYTAKVAKDIEKQVGAYEQLTTDIGDLEEQFKNLKAADQPIPNDLIHQIISKKGELKEVEAAVTNIGTGLAVMSMKQAGVVVSGMPGQAAPFAKRDNTTAGAPEGTEKGLDLGFGDMTPGGKKDFAVEQASVVQNAIFDIIKSNQQAALDNKLSINEKEKAAELKNKNLTEQQKLDIEEKYAAKAKKIKLDAFKKQKAADIIQGIMSTALAVIKALPNIPLAIAAGIAGAAEVAVIAAQPTPEFYEGGYTASDMSNRKPVGIVHANEFVGSAEAVRNPSIKQYFDVIDYAQKAGTVSQINLTSMYPNANNNQPVFKSGGYAPTSGASIQYNDLLANSNNRKSIDAYQIDVLGKLAEAITDLQKNGVKGKWHLNDLEKIQRDKRNIESSVNM